MKSGQPGPEEGCAGTQGQCDSRGESKVMADNAREKNSQDRQVIQLL